MPLSIYREEEQQPVNAAAVSKKNEPTGQSPRFDIRGNKVYFISLGCPRNLVDTEVMLGVLLRNGYEVAPELPQADYIVINTCGFLQASRQESLDTIGMALDTRKKAAKVIVAGCMVQSHSAEIKEHHPSVDYLLGSGDVEKILQAVESEVQGEGVTQARSYLEVGEVPRQVSTPRHYAFLKIAEGCRKRCAYCIIPDIKGPLKSKSIEQILKEFKILRQGGAKEIILIAQDLGDWGKDIGYKRTEGLIALLQEILKEPGDYWLRLLYLYPDEISDELIALMKSDSRICPYLDMPIQHINDTLLKSMRRATSKNQICDIIAKLRKEIPQIAIRTSLIVGFPGETDAQFEELVAFVKEFSLDQVGIFKFSKEPGSHAATLPDQISDDIKEKRFKKLVKAQQRVVDNLLQRRVGQKIRVIVEGYHPETQLLLRARHAGQCPDIDGEVLINEGQHRVKAFGEWHTVEITGHAGYDLVAKVIA